MKGVLHVHSTFSDGEESLEVVLTAIRRSGFDFVAVSDHAEVFDDVRMHDYVALCESLSSTDFVVIPGLEFALHGGDIHILGYGVSRRVRATDMEKLVDGIHCAGGIAVLAHPPAGAINMIGPIRSKLDGIEVWNSRYDGVHAPRAESLQLLRRVRMTNPSAVAFGGIDLHKISQIQRPIYVDVDSNERSPQSILKALVNGRSSVQAANTRIPSTGTLTFVQELSIAVKQPLCRPRAG